VGGRLDQTLANIFLLALPSIQSCEVRIENGSDEAFLIKDSGNITGETGDTVTLLPPGVPAYGLPPRG